LVVFPGIQPATLGEPITSSADQALHPQVIQDNVSMPVKALILRAPGTNCDAETAYAFERAGAVAERIFIQRLLESPGELAAAQILCLPGGFSYGDDIASGRILGMQLRRHLGHVLADFHAAGKLILGICNGFQVLLKCGLLCDAESTGPQATLDWNESGQFTDCWVQLRANPSRCVFLRDLETLSLPIAHGEGRFVAKSAGVLQQWRENGQLALSYAAPDCTTQPDRAPFTATDQLLPWPHNPNGSQGNVAGVCDPSGRVFGLMPHPERYLDRTQHPRWTRGEGTDPGAGLKIFRNAVEAFA
jgi:phosphoribosylformylglycinamidine synthase